MRERFLGRTGEARRHQTETLSFHVIFMPGSVRPMTLFLMTLLDHSDGCEFVVVANACTRDEKKFLRRVTERHPRLQYFELAAPQPLSHAAALHELAAMARGDWFCFLDNDILADAEFLPALRAAAESNDAVFSCPPIWTELEDRVHKDHWRRLGGRYHVTESGMVVGATFLAMYSMNALQKALAAGAQFGRVRWQALPESIQGELQRLGMQKDAYDTGKVVNLMLLAGGGRLAHVDLPGLHHVGGVSVLAHPEVQPNLQERRAAKLDSVADDERQSIESRLVRREFTASYIGDVLRHLFDGSPAPPPPSSDDPRLDDRLGQLTELIQRAYARHAAELF
jgi:hypothetical protein